MLGEPCRNFEYWGEWVVTPNLTFSLPKGGFRGLKAVRGYIETC